MEVMEFCYRDPNGIDFALHSSYVPYYLPLICCQFDDMTQADYIETLGTGRVASTGCLQRLFPGGNQFSGRVHDHKLEIFARVDTMPEGPITVWLRHALTSRIGVPFPMMRRLPCSSSRHVMVSCSPIF